MFKAVLKKSRDGGKGNKKDSGMWMIRWKNRTFSVREVIPSARQFETQNYCTSDRG